MTLNASSKNGFISDKDLRYAQRRASSAPLAITGAAYINKEGQLLNLDLVHIAKNISKDCPNLL